MGIAIGNYIWYLELELYHRIILVAYWYIWMLGKLTDFFANSSASSLPGMPIWNN